MTNYKVVDGVSFDVNTPEKVVNLLLYYMNARPRQRIRVFYGDTKTGKDWGEEWDTMGYVGRSGGTVKIPLLVNNARSYGGDAIKTGSIVRITVDRRNVYVHPKYNCNVTVRGVNVYKNGSIYAVCKTNEKAKKLALFLKGDSNVKG